MNKLDIQKRVLQYGVPLDLDKFEWDEKAKVFSTTEDDLVIDFNNIDYCTIIAGSYSTITIGSDCTITIYHDCTIIASSFCTIRAGNDNTIITYRNCTIRAGNDNTITTYYDSTITTGSNSVLIRRDIFEFFKLPEGKTIKLNKFEVEGFKIIEDKKIITVNGENIEISKESFEDLKEQLINKK